MESFYISPSVSKPEIVSRSDTHSIISRRLPASSGAMPLSAHHARYADTSRSIRGSISGQVYADVPEGSEELSQLDGVVFMNGGMFFVQFYDEASKCLNALPLYMFFGFDMLPAVGAAVKVIGNMYDDEELYSETLNLKKE